MKEQFATYEVSKQLKELKFDTQCFGHYNTDGELFLRKRFDKTNGEYYGTEAQDCHEENCIAPLWQQVKQWLWEKHEIWITKIQILEDCTDVWIKDENQEGVQKFYIKTYSPITAEIEGITKAVEYLHKKLNP